MFIKKKRSEFSDKKCIKCGNIYSPAGAKQKYCSDLCKPRAPSTYRKSELQDAIKDLEFKLSESEFHVDLLTATDEMSQAIIKDLTAQNAALVDALKGLANYEAIGVAHRNWLRPR